MSALGARWDQAAGERVAIAVGGLLRLANADFDRAIRRLLPQTLFELIMQDLDDLERQ